VEGNYLNWTMKRKGSWTASRCLPIICKKRCVRYYSTIMTTKKRYTRHLIW